jgi:hypothetical protein
MSPTKLFEDDYDLRVAVAVCALHEHNASITDLAEHYDISAANLTDALLPGFWTPQQMQAANEVFASDIYGSYEKPAAAVAKVAVLYQGGPLDGTVETCATSDVASAVRFGKRGSYVLSSQAFDGRALLFQFRAA